MRRNPVFVWEFRAANRRPFGYLARIVWVLGPAAIFFLIVNTTSQPRTPRRAWFGVVDALQNLSTLLAFWLIALVIVVTPASLAASIV